MRKIETREDRERKKSRNKTIIGIILVIIMIFSTIGFAFLGKDSEESVKKINYEGFEFVLGESGFWNTKIENYEFTTSYNPLETENISLPFLISLQEYLNKPLYFVSEKKYGVNEIHRNLYSFVERMQDVCLENRNCTGNLAIKNCSSNIIIIDHSNTTKAYRENNCVFIETDNDALAADALLFKMLGIRKF